MIVMIHVVSQGCSLNYCIELVCYWLCLSSVGFSPEERGAHFLLISMSSDMRCGVSNTPPILSALLQRQLEV